MIGHDRGADVLDVTCLAAGRVAGEMRRHIECRLSGWRLAAITHDSCLVATELIVNACRATPDGEIRIKLAREPNAVLFGVWDASDHLPNLQPAGVLDRGEPNVSDADGGWGLSLVRAIATECGVRRTAPNGKWVWARLAAPSSAAPEITAQGATEPPQRGPARTAT